MVNAMYGERFAIGIVPSYLHNSHLPCPDVQYSFTLGVHAQYYITDVFNVLLELNPTVSGWRTAHNPVSFGIELETGGHFFKVILSNSDLLNPRNSWRERATISMTENGISASISRDCSHSNITALEFA